MRIPLAFAVRQAFFVALMGAALSCGGGGGSSSPTSPSGGPTTGTAVEEISPNPQVWTALSSELQLPTFGPGFTPTKTMRMGGILRTYYVRADGFVGFAESTDGTNFTNGTATNIRISTTPGDVRFGLEHPTVILKPDGRFLMLYDYRTDPTSQFAKRLIARTSADGITWGDGVVLPASAMTNSPSTGQPFVGVTGLVPMPDGSIRAYYTVAGGLIGSARTTDGGASWTEDAGFRLGVISFSPQAYIGPGAIMDVDGTILLYVTYITDFNCTQGAGTPTGCGPIRMARSSDGLNFKVYAGNVLMPGSGPIRYDDPDIFITPSGRWRILFGEGNRGSNKLRIADRQ